MGFILSIQRRESLSIKLYSLFFIFCSRFILTAVSYPIHPVTWAILPLTGMTYFLLHEKYHKAFWCAVILFIFKETFAFGFFGLSFYFLTIKKIRLFSLYFVTSLVMIIFELKFRNMLLGGIISYANSYASQIFNAPLLIAEKVLRTFFSGAFWKGFAGYLIPFYYIIKYYPPKKFPNIYAPLFYIAPLIGIHLIIERFYFHHASKFGIVLSCICLFSGVLHKITSLPWKRQLIIILALFLPAMSSFKLFFKVPFLYAFEMTEKYSQPVAKSFKKASQLTTHHYKKNQKIYSTGGLALRALKPRMKLYHHNSSEKQKTYDFILLERNNYGSPWPLNHHQVEAIIDRCRKYSQAIIHEDKYSFLMRGRFPSECIYHND